MPSTYHAVLFDLDGTLRESQPHFMDALYQCLLDKDIQVDTFTWRLTERWVHHYWAQSPELVADIEENGPGNIWAQFIARLMTHVGHPPHPDEVAAFGQYVSDTYQPSSRLVAGARETLTTLKQTGVILGVLSNRRHVFTGELQELGIDSFFDFTLAAGEVGVWKPMTEIFLHALQRGGDIAPDTAIYIGDNYYADIVGATSAGIDAILLDERGVFTDMNCAKVQSLPEILIYLDGHLLPGAA
ncbi:MAG: HAD family hydrolase [Chloroflexi bacterium]|nr:HAD family hydrolase [Chloroflexota bacterium]